MARRKKRPDDGASQPEGAAQPPNAEGEVSAEPVPPPSAEEAAVGNELTDERAGAPASSAGSFGAATEVGAETRSRRAFFGRSGHLAVMAEFLHRRINVAIPEVDVGDDLFVVKGTGAEVVRVQVKSATAREQQNSYVALINVPEAQLKVPDDNPPLVYVFAIRRGEGKRGRWNDFFVVRRSTLYARSRNEQAGTLHVDPDGRRYVQYRLVLTDDTAISGPGQVNFQNYRDAWAPWPPPTLADEDNASGPDQEGGAAR
jgi:hypothetical protein